MMYQSLILPPVVLELLIVHMELESDHPQQEHREEGANLQRSNRVMQVEALGGGGHLCGETREEDRRKSRRSVLRALRYRRHFIRGCMWETLNEAPPLRMSQVDWKSTAQEALDRLPTVTDQRGNDNSGNAPLIRRGKCMR